MDFFGILFDMKNGKKIPYNKTYFDTLLAESLAGVTTLTGALPLTFTTSETALRSWTIYGNNTPHNYSATGTLPLTFYTHTAGDVIDWSIYGNADGVGERTAQLFDINNVLENYYLNNGVPTQINIGGYVLSDYIPIESNQTTISIKITNESRYGAHCAVYDENKTFIRNVGGFVAQGEGIIKHVMNTSGASFIRIDYSSKSFTNCMLNNGSIAIPYVPYGYTIPLTVSQQGQPDKTVDIYIGGSPLTEGETVSKASTGVDIELFEGENTIETTLYNKPSMSIEGVDYVGVGEPTNDSWQIPLSVSDGTNTTTVNVPIDAPLTDGQTVTDTLTINTFEGENVLDTTLTDPVSMTIKFKE